MGGSPCGLPRARGGDTTGRERWRIVRGNRRRLFLRAWDEARGAGRSLSAFGRDFGFHRDTLYRWLRERDGGRGSPIRRVAPRLKAKALEIYRRYGGTWGAETISLALGGRISPYTVRRTLLSERAGERQAGVARTPRLAFLRWREPDFAWSTDWTICRVGRKEYFLLLLMDEATRFWLGWALLDRAPGTSEAAALLSDAFRRYRGRPLLLKSDRAGAFMSSEWRAFLAAEGIVHCRGRPGVPQDQAVIERQIREVKAWVACQASDTAEELERCVREGILMLNFLKPRRVLDGRTPGAAYFGSPITLPTPGNVT